MFNLTDIGDDKFQGIIDMLKSMRGSKLKGSMGKDLLPPTDEPIAPHDEKDAPQLPPQDSDDEEESMPSASETMFAKKPGMSGEKIAVAKNPKDMGGMEGGDMNEEELKELLKRIL